ncbi:MAG: hypothetical protein ABJO27_22435 [Pseudoruegeria sp.]
MAISTSVSDPAATSHEASPLDLSDALVGTGFGNFVSGQFASEIPKPSVFLGGVPNVVMFSPEGMSDTEVYSAAAELVAISEGPLVPALYDASAEGITHEGWAAVTSHVGGKVDDVMSIVDKLLDGGADFEGADGLAGPLVDGLLAGDPAVVQAAAFELNGIEELQERLGLSDTPQGQAVSIAAASVNVLSQALAGAIANPEEGMDHLEDVRSTFQSVAGTLTNLHDDTSFQNTDTFLENSVTTVTNIEVLNSGMVDDLVENIDLSELSPEDARAFGILINPEGPANNILGSPDVVGAEEDFDFADPGGDVETPPVLPEIEGPVVARGETPFFESNFGLDDNVDGQDASIFAEEEVGVYGEVGEVSVEFDAETGVEEEAEVSIVGDSLEEVIEDHGEVEEVSVEFDAETGIEEEAEVSMVGDSLESPILDLGVIGEVSEDDSAENGDVSDFDNIIVDFGEADGTSGTGDVVEIEGGPDLLVDDAPSTQWYERPISTDLFKVEELGEGVSELYNEVIDNADSIIGEQGFFDTGVMTGFAAYLEEVGEALDGVTPEEAEAISDIIAPLLLDLDQGQFMLEQMGLTDSALYGATQVMTEVLGAVFYGGKVAETNAAAGADILNSIEPQITLLAGIFGEITDGYAATGVANADLFSFFIEARDAASDVYKSVYQLNEASVAPVLPKLVIDETEAEVTEADESE